MSDLVVALLWDVFFLSSVAAQPFLISSHSRHSSSPQSSSSQPSSASSTFCACVLKASPFLYKCTYFTGREHRYSGHLFAWWATSAWHISSPISAMKFCEASSQEWSLWQRCRIYFARSCPCCPYHQAHQRESSARRGSCGASRNTCTDTFLLGASLPLPVRPYYSDRRGTLRANGCSSDCNCVRGCNARDPYASRLGLQTVHKA